MNLSIKNLSVKVSNRRILNNISLQIEKGSIVALMGPNGSGKSSLAQVLMGHPSYTVEDVDSVKASVKLGSDEILELSPDKRANLGLFLAFQNPVSVPGVTVANLLRTAVTEKEDKEKKQDLLAFNESLFKKTENLSIAPNLLRRGLNEDFSGGEKKKLEMLQAEVLNPKFAIFDEIDTGLDVDALKIVAKSIANLKRRGCGVLLITHYQRILKFAKPDYVYIMVKGEIKEKGDYTLAKEVEKNGYKKWLKL